MYFHSIRIGESFKFTDEDFLSKFPHTKERVYILSSYKVQNRMFYIMVNGEKGCQKFRLNNLPEIEKVEAEKVVTLAIFGNKYKWSDEKPTQVTLNVNGEAGTYEIAPDFWRENFSNIHLHGLKRYGSRYSIPGASLVMNSK